MSIFLEDEAGESSDAFGTSSTAQSSLESITPLPSGQRFVTHALADQWLSEQGLSGDVQVWITYQEVETVDSVAQTKTTRVPLRDAVTPGFMSAHQSRDIQPTGALSPRQGWVYPHISHMSLDLSSIRVNGLALTPAQMQPLRAGIPSNYQGSGRPVVTGPAQQGPPLGPREAEQIRQLDALDANEAKLARLFAGLPTFDNVMHNLLISNIKAKVPARKFRPSLFQSIDPQNWYVNHFTTDTNGVRSLTRSERFIDVLWESLLRDTPPSFPLGGIGFFTDPQAVTEADSVFASPVDAAVLRAMESAFHVPTPTCNDSLKAQLRADLLQFRNTTNRAGLPDTDANATPPPTAQAVFADLLGRRFLHFFQLYQVDRTPTGQLTESARLTQYDEDRLLDLITTHPSQAARSRLLRPPIPLVFAVMLDMGSAPAQKWPAAMVIRQANHPVLFLYSMEGGLQRFGSSQALISTLRPLHAGQQRTIQSISRELTGHVFEVAANDLLQRQVAALEKVFDVAASETTQLQTFAQDTEEALALPQLALSGPLAVRQQALIEYNRPDFYKTSSFLQQERYRVLEERVIRAVQNLGSGIPTLMQFTRQQIKQYLQRTVHPDLDPDPDTTTVRLFFGSTDNPRQSTTTSLTQLMLDNLRPSKNPAALGVLPTHLLDRQGQRIRNPSNGYLITLSGSELATMTTTLDAGGSYETMLREQLNQPEYKTAWQAAYLANMRFKGHEAALRGDEVFKRSVIDRTIDPSRSQKLVALWLDVILQQSPPANKHGQVMGKNVRLYGLTLGGTMGVTGVLRSALKVEGALIFTDQAGPDIKGTVGVYFPDSPGGQDFHEFSDLSEGVTELLWDTQWQAYFRARLPTPYPAEIRHISGQAVRPWVRATPITGDFIETLHREHVDFQVIYADPLSNSNRDVQREIRARLTLVAIDIVQEIAGMLMTPGIVTFLKSMARTGVLIAKTGAIPLNLKTLLFAHKIANYPGRSLARATTNAARGRASFLALATRRKITDDALPGLPLEEAVYQRFAVTDTSVLRATTTDEQGFYRMTIVNPTTGSVTRPVYIRQPEGTLFRVHDNTKHDATEAVIVDPSTGLNIHSSGVMRSTVARMPNGEWRAVGFGHGGGKRKHPTSTPAQPNAAQAPQTSTPATIASISDSIRSPGIWNTNTMDLVPALMTRLPSWPQHRSLLLISEIPGSRPWSVHFTPGQAERIYPAALHPERNGTDIVLRRTTLNHYNLQLGQNIVEIPADGDCFFNAVVRGLNEGGQGRFTMQGLRNEAAYYVDQHPELTAFIGQPVSPLQQAFLDNVDSLVEVLDDAAVLDLTSIVVGFPNPHRLFQPVLDYLERYANWVGRRTLEQARQATLPPEILHNIGRFLSPRSPASLMPDGVPYNAQDPQAVRQFFEEILLEPVDSRLIEQLLGDKFLTLNTDVKHIMLEYGVTARQLAEHHPEIDEAFVLYDSDVHGHLDDDAIEELIDGAYLVDRDDLDDIAGRLQAETGQDINDDETLFQQFVYYQNAEETVDLLRAALGRFPDLLRRFNILCASPVIDAHLGGALDVSLVTRWLRAPTISDERLRLIAEYSRTRYEEVLRTESIDIEWMRFFTDQNLRTFITHRQSLMNFLESLKDIFGDVESVDLPSAVRYFSVAGQAPSNTRIEILLNHPNLLPSILSLPRHHIRRIWEDLVGPYFSDSTIRQVLAQPGAVDSAENLALAISAGLGGEDARANQIVRDLFRVTQSQAQRYLYNFDFPSHLAGRSRLDFALHLESDFQVPDWAWAYARPGVTVDSLKSFRW
ncbi:hypothetical protein OC610_06530 [Pseudomonas sp. SAICEU22]|uniref:Dermonecrotic toxin N-terminal domain-containing protein n=1 Tax=Pseudomonas agronomica TaxID=2979328 RepID=A0ABT3F4M0_9PSED|nr:DUF6543 domain-containing protein [Pseudomonas agronomica]MCW1244057.1 hypothetical protein [Pseudomonas agronomica]